MRTFLEHKDYTTAIDINPHYITPKMLQFRLQKIMDEYVAGCATYYNTNDKMLAVAEEKLEMLKEDAPRCAPRTCTSCCAPGRTTTASSPPKRT